MPADSPRVAPVEYTRRAMSGPTSEGSTDTALETDTGGANDALHVVLVEPEIHGNTGNIGRSCLATGAQLHLVEPLGFSLDDAHVRRAGLDYWRHVQPQVWGSWEHIESRLPELGEPWFFSAEGKRLLWDVEYPRRTVLLFGRESAGFSNETRDRYADRMVRIPIVGQRVRSLNLANSVAVALCEVLRQRLSV